MGREGHLTMRDNCSRGAAEYSGEILIDEDCWLTVTVLGMRLRVYKSVELRETDEMYRPVLEITGRGAPISRKIVRDASMMFGLAEDLVFNIVDKISSSIEGSQDGDGQRRHFLSSDRI